jgi:hypothetical protein
LSHRSIGDKSSNSAGEATTDHLTPVAQETEAATYPAEAIDPGHLWRPGAVASYMRMSRADQPAF